MATDITNPSSFSFSNMKPAADEEIAALWGQNIADNTGYLYNLPVNIMNFTARYNNALELDATGLNYAKLDKVTGTFSFIKTANVSSLIGTVDFVGTLSGNGTTYIYVDGGTALASDWGTLSQFVKEDSFNLDISSYTNGNKYKISYLMDDIGNYTINPGVIIASVSIYGTSE